jgi:hypothetical protein
MAQRLLGIGAERAEAHAGDGDGDIELDRFLGETLADDHVGGALLAVTLERIARNRGAEEHEVIERRHLAPRAGAADGIDTLRRRTLDLGDHVRREGGGFTNRAIVHCDPSAQKSDAWSIWKLYMRRAEP